MLHLNFPLRHRLGLVHLPLLGRFCTPFRLYILTGIITTCYGCKERFVRAGPQYNLIVQHEKTDHSSTQGQVLQCYARQCLLSC